MNKPSPSPSLERDFFTRLRLACWLCKPIWPHSHPAGQKPRWQSRCWCCNLEPIGRCIGSSVYWDDGPPAVQPATFQNASTFANAAPSLEGNAFHTAGLTPGTPAALATGPASVCFIGIENKSAEELGDFKDQLYERIDTQINSAETFRAISRRMVDAALLETRLRPDALFLPANRAAFAAALGRQGAPVDYLLYATVTSGNNRPQ